MNTEVRFGLRRRGAGWLRLLGIGVGIGLLVLLEPLGNLARGEPIQRGDVAYEDEMAKGRVHAGA